MNTIPIIFNERQINTTILGGKTRPENAKLDVAVILLNKTGSQFHIQMLENLVRAGFSSIISFEPNKDNVNIAENAKRFPTVKFIVPLEDVTAGDMINIGMSEVSASYVLVLRDSLYIPSLILTPNLAERLVKSEAYCIVPRLFNADKQSVAARSTPVAEKNKLWFEMTHIVPTDTATAYPFDYIGLYNRKKFLQLGGFDYTIVSPHYQNADLSLRAWLWGEKILMTPSFQMNYAEAAPIENITADVTYLHFYLKNMMPVFRTDHAEINKLSFFRFFRNSSCGFFEARKFFKDAVKWTYKNRFRFKTDMEHLIENWNRENE